MWRLLCAELTLGIVMTTCGEASEPNWRPSMPANVTLATYSGSIPPVDDDDQPTGAAVELDELCAGS